MAGFDEAQKVQVKPGKKSVLIDGPAEVPDDFPHRIKGQAGAQRMDGEIHPEETMIVRKGELPDQDRRESWHDGNEHPIQDEER